MGDNRIFLALFEMPKDENLRLAPDSVVHVYDAKVIRRNPGTIDKVMAFFHATVTPPIVGLPGLMLPLHMPRQWNKEDKQTFGDIESIRLKDRTVLPTNVKKMQEFGSI